MDDSGLNISTKLKCSIFTGCQSLPSARIKGKILQWQQTDANIAQPFIESRFFYFKLQDRFWKEDRILGVVGAQGLLAKCSTNFPFLSFASVFQVHNVQIRAALGRKLKTEYWMVHWNSVIKVQAKRNWCASNSRPNSWKKLDLISWF